MQIEEIEENNRMGKTRDLFKKIRDFKQTVHAKMGLIKDRKEYTEELNKKDLHDPDNHDGVIAHLEPDILECEVKWALGSITMNKASGGDEIEVELFQMLKDDSVKCCTQYASKFENSAGAKKLEKISFHSSPKERQCQRMLKLPHNCIHLTH